MKKSLIALLMIIVLCGCSTNTSNIEATFEDNYNYETLMDTKHNIKKVSLDELKELEKKGKYFLLVGRPSCPPCTQAIVDFKDVSMEAGIEEVYYFDVEEITNDYSDGKLSEKNEVEAKHLEDFYNFEGSTPSFYYVDENKKVNAISDELIERSDSWKQILEEFIGMYK